MLEREGVLVTVVSDGAEAVDVTLSGGVEGLLSVRLTPVEWNHAAVAASSVKASSYSTEVSLPKAR